MMEVQATQERYTRVAVVLHWLIAVFILMNLSLGYFMEGFKAPLKDLVITAHESAGLTILALTVARVVWRLTHKPPSFPDEMRSLEVSAASVVHFLLYGAMVVMPLIGWAIISAHPPPGSPGAAAAAAARHASSPAAQAPIARALPPAGRPGSPTAKPQPAGRKLWWVVPMPQITPVQAIGTTPGGVKPQKELHDEFVTWHGLGGYVLIALLLLHIGGALKHEVFDGQAELARMGVGRLRRAGAT